MSAWRIEGAVMDLALMGRTVGATAIAVTAPVVIGNALGLPAYALVIGTGIGGMLAGCAMMIIGLRR